MKTKPTTKNKCPLCEQNNDCQVNSTSCWCMNVKVDAELLKASLSDEDLACLCKQCLSRFLVSSRD